MSPKHAFYFTPKTPFNWYLSPDKDFNNGKLHQIHHLRRFPPKHTNWLLWALGAVRGSQTLEIQSHYFLSWLSFTPTWPPPSRSGLTAAGLSSSNTLRESKQKPKLLRLYRKEFRKRGNAAKLSNVAVDRDKVRPAMGVTEHPASMLLISLCIPLPISLITMTNGTASFHYGLFEGL